MTKEKEMTAKRFSSTDHLGVFQGDDKYHVQRMADFDNGKLTYIVIRLSALGNKTIQPMSPKFKEIVTYVEAEVYNNNVDFETKEQSESGSDGDNGLHKSNGSSNNSDT